MASITFKRTTAVVKEKRAPVAAVEVTVDGKPVGTMTMVDFAHAVASVSARPMSPDLVSDTLHALMRGR